MPDNSGYSPERFRLKRNEGNNRLELQTDICFSLCTTPCAIPLANHCPGCRAWNWLRCSRLHAIPRRWKEIPRSRFSAPILAVSHKGAALLRRHRIHRCQAWRAGMPRRVDPPRNSPRELAAGFPHVGSIDHGEMKRVQSDYGIDLFWRGEGEPRYDKWFLHVFECMDRFYEIVAPKREQPKLAGWRYIGTIADGTYAWWDFQRFNPDRQDGRLVWTDVDAGRKSRDR